MVLILRDGGMSREGWSCRLSVAGGGTDSVGCCRDDLQESIGTGEPGFSMGLGNFAEGKKKDRAIPARSCAFLASTVNPYAISGILFTERSAVICFFNHTLALHRPTNGAAAIIPNEIPKAICIQLLLSPWGP
jgi:hypothetical protein